MAGFPRALAALCVASACAAASAATLQITPVTIELAPSAAAASMTLSNPGGQPIYGQVRTYRWTQQNGDDVVTPTDMLAASPPLLQIGANAEQLIRLVRTGRGAPPAEESYRVLIDELPAPGTPVANGVTIRLRYSVPVFVEPDGAPASPKLDWRVERDGAGTRLAVDNLGGRRAQTPRFGSSTRAAPCMTSRAACSAMRSRAARGAGRSSWMRARRHSSGSRRPSTRSRSKRG